MIGEDFTMRIEESISGENIMWMVIVLVVAVALVTTTITIKSCQNEEIELYLKAGCEKVYVPGRVEPTWSNCKKPLEMEK